MEIPATYEGFRDALGAAATRLAGRLGGRFAAYALAGADLFVLFGRVMADGRVPRAQRGELIAAALYVASPLDVIPEVLFGPVGLVDDAAVIARFFDTLLNRVPIEVVRDHWPGDVLVLERLQGLAADGRDVFGRGLAEGLKQLVKSAAETVERRARQLGFTPRESSS